MERRADYGYDAPYALVAFTGIACLCVLGALVSSRTGAGNTALAGAYGAFFPGKRAPLLHTARCGKFLVWERILDGLCLRGDERVLDLGCGRGAVLNVTSADTRAVKLSIQKERITIHGRSATMGEATASLDVIFDGKPTPRSGGG